MSLLFGNLTQQFVVFGSVVTRMQAGDPTAALELPAAAEAFRRTAALDASYIVYIGIGTLVCTVTLMTTWVYTGEKNAKRLREEYLKAVLRQDVAWFDTVGAGEITTRIQSDTSKRLLSVTNCFSDLLLILCFCRYGADGYL